MIVIRIQDLEQTCWACPSQWSGKTIDGKPVYIRYRWGYLSVRVADWTKNPVGDGEEVFGISYGDGLDGVMSTMKLQEVCNSYDLVRII